MKGQQPFHWPKLGGSGFEIAPLVLGAVTRFERQRASPAWTVDNCGTERGSLKDRTHFFGSIDLGEGVQRDDVDGACPVAPD